MPTSAVVAAMAQSCTRIVPTSALTMESVSEVDGEAMRALDAVGLQVTLKHGPAGMGELRTTKTRRRNLAGQDLPLCWSGRFGETHGELKLSLTMLLVLACLSSSPLVSGVVDGMCCLSSTGQCRQA